MSNTTGPGRPDGLHTLGRWTTDRSLATPHRVAIDDRGCTLLYSELERRAAALAAGFRAAGYGIGDRIATLTGNSSDHVVAFFACAKAGLVLVPLSWRLSPRELSAQLELAEPQLLLVEGELDALAAAACALLPHRRKVCAAAFARSAGSAGRGGPFPPGSARRRRAADDFHLRHRGCQQGRRPYPRQLLLEQPVALADPRHGQQ
jgi:fatty-acyl-CoA synthase